MARFPMGGTSRSVVGMSSHLAPRRLRVAQPTDWVLQAVIALFVVIGLLLLAVVVASQVREGHETIWAPGPFASSPAPHVVV